jgi:hypothetical protein
MKSEPNKSLELSPKVSSISIGLSLLGFHGSDAAAQLNSMLGLLKNGFRAATTSLRM